MSPIVTVFIISIFTMIFISPIRGYFGFSHSSLFGFTVYFILTIWSFRRYSEKLTLWKILLALFLGLSVIQFPMRVFYFEKSLISFPDYIVHILALLCGFLYWYSKKPLNILAGLFGFLIAFFMYFQGYTLWLHYLNFNTFTGKVTAYKLQQKIEGTNKNNNQTNNQTLENKIVLLDFWHTRCGVCFQKFPQLQAFYDKYKNDDSIAVFAVDKPIQEDKQKSAFKVIEEEGYNFPVLLPNDEDLPEKFGVKYYPTTFVINRQGNVVYKGSIEGAILTAEELKRNNQ
jgi:thiol-disulfide isomerase/thioredoxin